MPRSRPEFHFMEEISIGGVQSLEHHSHALRSLNRINRILVKVRKTNPSSDVENRARGLFLENPSMSDRQRIMSGETSTIEDAKYQGLCDHFKRNLRAVAGAWVGQSPSGKGQGIIKKALGEDKLEVKVMDTAAPGLFYEPERETITFVMPSSQADEAMNTISEHGAFVGEKMVDSEIISSGHHEISEFIKAINIGAEGKPVDIVHHTSGLVGQAIGPALPHSGISYPDGDLDHVFTEVARRGKENIAQRDALDALLTRIERDIKGGRIHHNAIINAIDAHVETFGPQDPDDLRSAHLAHRIMGRLQNTNPKRRQGAIRRLYSSDLASEAELEGFISEVGGGKRKKKKK